MTFLTLTDTISEIQEDADYNKKVLQLLDTVRRCTDEIEQKYSELQNHFCYSTEDLQNLQEALNFLKTKVV